MTKIKKLIIGYFNLNENKMGNFYPGLNIKSYFHVHTPNWPIF